MIRELGGINIVLTITGIAPVFDRRNKNGEKYSMIGICFSVIGIFAVFYVDHLESYMLELYRAIFKDVMFGMVHLKRLIDISSPIGMICGSIVQFESLNGLCQKMDKFDEFLIKNNVNISIIHRRKQQATIIILLGTLVTTIICIVSVVYRGLIYQPMSIQLFYIGSVYYINFVLVTLKVCKYLFGISLRMDLFKQVLDNIKFRHSDRRDLVPRYPPWQVSK